MYFACIGLVAALFRYGKSAGREPFIAAFLLIAASRGPVIGFFSLFFSLLVSHFSIIRRPGMKTLSLVLLLSSAFFSLYLGLFGLSRLAGEFRHGGVPAGLPVSGERLGKAGDSFIWIGDADATPTRTILVLDRGKGAAGFQLFPEGLHDPEKGTLRILKTGREIRLSGGDAGEAPRFIAPFIRDLSYIASSAAPKELFDPRAAVFVFALAFFGFSLWTPARFSRWPLFNVWIVFGLAWLVLTAVHFIGTGLAPELARLERLGPVAAYLPAAFPGVCGMVLFLGGLLLRPLSDWKRDLRV